MSLSFRAAIFDMDGVITRTASLHAAAWKELFDDLLRRLAPPGQAFRPFDERAEYRAHVDGKPRMEGVRSFLRARQLTLPEPQVQELAHRKDALFARRLQEQGVETFDSTIALVRELRGRGVRTGVVTSSRHGREILGIAGIEALFDARLDGIDIGELGLAGKPDPDMFLTCAEALGAAPGRTLVFEDAVAGRAGRPARRLRAGGGDRPGRQRGRAGARRRGPRRG